MKKFLQISLIALALPLAGCAFLSSGEKSILQGGQSITAEIGQPISNEVMFNLEATWRAALVAAVTYRRQGICAPGTVWTVQKPCAEERVILTIQKYLPAARSAMASLRSFRAQGDTTNAYKVFVAAKAAVAQLQNELFLAGVK